MLSSMAEFGRWMAEMCTDATTVLLRGWLAGRDLLCPCGFEFMGSDLRGCFLLGTIFLPDGVPVNTVKFRVTITRFCAVLLAAAAVHLLVGAVSKRGYLGGSGSEAGCLGDTGSL